MSVSLCVCAAVCLLLVLVRQRLLSPHTHTQLKPAGVSQLVQRVLDMEGNADHWSLKDRWVWVPVFGGVRGGLQMV